VNEKSLLLSTGEQLPYGFCVWAAGVGPTPLVQDLVKLIPEQVEVQAQSRGRVATDGWLRVRGCDGLYCIGDCNFVENSPLPATAQVASQQGAYLGRLLSKGYRLGSYSPVEPPYKIIVKPVKEDDEGSSSSSLPLSNGNIKKSTLFPSERMGFGRLGREAPLVPASTVVAVVGESSSGRSDDKNILFNNSTENSELSIAYAKPFQFLNLGVLAYVGASQALAQVSFNEKNILGSGPLGFLLWRGIYWFKQVSWRNRVLIAVDWVKARFFGRDIGRL